MAIGNRPVGIIVARFQNLNGSDAPFLRGYQYQGSARRQSWMRGATTLGFGKDLKAQLRRPGPWEMTIGGLGEPLPDPHNRMTLDHTRIDPWGLPEVKIHYTVSENDRQMAKHMADEGAAMLTAAGATQVVSDAGMMRPGLGIHECGTARMGRDPKTSVLNRHNQAHAVPNLFVTDGACMASAPNQNPSLTYMALTARAARYAVDRLRTGAL
jgi:choline dehydrogenase-like flavoprotein